ncbi:MAG TPA: hypothetical protein VLU92_04195 [Candidatus Dormibacteraeota bacterium]|nr:hypothetical protein [Candidatus Dormibacteraeota bacterium]
MSQRLLLSLGVVAIAASLLLGFVGVATPRVSMMGGAGNSVGHGISMDRAQQSVQSFVDRTGNSDLRVDELMEFDRNFYALIKEKSTGIGAFELLVNKATGVVGYEPGPDMMWNAKYGMMGFKSTSGAMTVSPDRATQIAQGWLDQRGGGYTAGTPDAFYGYYTFHFLKNGQVAGMLSINGLSGQTWFHTWHGSFIQRRELGG